MGEDYFSIVAEKKERRVGGREKENEKGQRERERLSVWL